MQKVDANGLIFTAPQLTEALFFYRDRVEAHFDKPNVSQTLTAKRVALIFGIESMLQAVAKNDPASTVARLIRRRAMWSLYSALVVDYPALKDSDLADDTALRQFMMATTQAAKAVALYSLMVISNAHAKNGNHKKAMQFAIMAYADAKAARALLGLNFICERAAIYAIFR